MKTKWYIKPLGSYISANEEIARALNKLSLSVESEEYNMKDEKGNEHFFMWQVEHSLVQMLKDNKLTFGFRFRIFRRESQNGSLREWKFPTGKKSTKVKKAIADLKEIQKRKQQQKGAA